MSLKRKENTLRRAQKKFDRVNKSKKQFQIEFRREQNRHGRFRTRAHIIRDYKEYHGNNRGLIHKAVNLKYRIKGDKPSVTRTLKSWKPKTAHGRFLKSTACTVNFAVHDVVKTAADTALAGETISLKTAESAGRELQNKLRQKYTHEAVDDCHRGVFLMGRTAYDAVKGTGHHLKTSKQYRREKAKFRLQRADNRLFREKSYNPKIRTLSSDLHTLKVQYKSNRNTDRSSKLRKAFNKRRFQYYRQEKREFNFERKKLKTGYRLRTRELKNQKKVTRNVNPGFIALKPVSYTAGRMKASAWQKAINEDQDNDVLHATQQLIALGTGLRLELSLDVHVNVLAAVIFDGCLSGRLQERICLSGEFQHHADLPRTVGLLGYGGLVCHHLTFHQILLRACIRHRLQGFYNQLRI